MIRLHAFFSECVLAETPFFFPGPQTSLFGILHESAADAPSGQPYVFCHPFGEEKLWAHRVFVTFARRLAAAGHPVLRFDYMANGDSEGDFSQFSVETALADINCAIDLLKTRTSAEQVGLLGLRLGASFATRAAAARRDVSTLVLWAPIVDCSRYMQELLRSNLTTQMAVYKEIRADREALIASLRVGQSVSVDGFDIGLSLYEQMSGLRLSEGSGPLVDRCFIAQIDRNETAPLSRDLEGLRAACPNATLQLVREDPFWKEIDRFYDSAPNLSAATMAWLKDA